LQGSNVKRAVHRIGIALIFIVIAVPSVSAQSKRKKKPAAPAKVDEL